MSILESTLALLAPHNCIICNAEGSILCAPCGYDIPTLPSICYICARATQSHRACEKHATKVKPQHVYIHSAYADDIKKLLHQYKFEYKRAASKDIARLLDESLPYFATAPLVTFVPTIGLHVRVRGFDHTHAVAKELARLRGWQYASLLAKQGDTTQIGSDRNTRKKQLAEAFRPDNIKLIKGAHILLVDDVITTGATIEACSKVLYKAGVQMVDVVALARTP